LWEGVCSRKAPELSLKLLGSLLPRLQGFKAPAVSKMAIHFLHTCFVGLSSFLGVKLL